MIARDTYKVCKLFTITLWNLDLTGLRHPIWIDTYSYWLKHG